MNTLQRIVRLSQHYSGMGMVPHRAGKLHACLNVLDYCAGIKTASRTGRMLFPGCAEYDTPIGARVDEHERHAGLVAPDHGKHYFWLGAETLSEMG